MFEDEWTEGADNSEILPGYEPGADEKDGCFAWVVILLVACAICFAMGFFCGKG